MTPVTKPGVYGKMPIADYIADPCPEPSLSASTVVTLVERSCLRAWYEHPRLNPGRARKSTSAQDIGSAAHAVVLEDDLNAIVWVAAKDWRTKAAKAERDAARAAGRIPMLEKFGPALASMNAAAQRFVEQTYVADEWRAATPEQTILWTEGDPAIWCRIRPDRMHVDHHGTRATAFHYKTTTNSEPNKFINGPLSGLSYDVSSEFYERGIRATFPGYEVESYWVVQEVEEPYECSIITSGGLMDQLAEAKVAHGIKRWRECITSGVWPSHDPRTAVADPKPYLVSQWEERTIAQGVEP